MKFAQIKKMFATSVVATVAIALSGCGGASTGVNQKIEGVVGPDVEYVNGRVVVSMVFQNINIDGGATIPIPKYPNSSIQIGPDFQSSGTLLVLTVNAADFLGNKGQGMNPQTLPGGRPLPSVASGVLPAIAIQLPKLMNMVFYVGPEIIGFFVPFNKLDLAGSILSFRFYNKTGNPIGILALVGSDSAGANAGILAMMRVDLLGIIKAPSSSTLAKLAAMVP